jgi:hypothetical protein
MVTFPPADAELLLVPSEPAEHAERAMAPTARPATRPRWAFFGSDTSLYLLVVEATGVAAGYWVVVTGG